MTNERHEWSISWTTAGMTDEELGWSELPQTSMRHRTHVVPSERVHRHPLYDCGGKGHGSDVSEVQWCHDCTPHVV